MTCVLVCGYWHSSGKAGPSGLAGSVAALWPLDGDIGMGAEFVLASVIREPLKLQRTGLSKNGFRGSVIDRDAAGRSGTFIASLVAAS